jgi:cyclic 2,3-diphosphoglycerate synthase
MGSGPVIALIDGEHHPSAVRDALASLDRPLAGVVFVGGEEKVADEVLESPQENYGHELHSPDDLPRLAGEAEAVLDLADEPILNAAAKMRFAARALSLGLAYEGPGWRIDAPRYERIGFDGPKLAVIGTGKRTGKTAVAVHWATLLREDGARPVVVSMGRGGPAEPQVASADTGLELLERIVAEGRHAASDYLEDALLASVPTVGCRRVGGGLNGAPFESNVSAGARLAASLDAGTLLFEGSGACIPPVEVDRTVCIVGMRDEALGELGPYRLMRADLALVMHGDEELARDVGELCKGDVLRCELRAEAAETLPDDARVAFFSTGEARPHDIDPVLFSPNLARRAKLRKDLDRAVSEGCDVYLTELKAAAIDTVAKRAREEGARVVFIRNRPVGVDGDLDEALRRLHDDA